MDPERTIPLNPITAQKIRLYALITCLAAGVMAHFIYWGLIYKP